MIELVGVFFVNTQLFFDFELSFEDNVLNKNC